MSEKNNNHWSIKKVFHEVFIQTGAFLFPLLLLMIFTSGIIWDKYSVYIINILNFLLIIGIWVFELVTNVKLLIAIAVIYFLIKFVTFANAIINISSCLKELKDEMICRNMNEKHFR